MTGRKVLFYKSNETPKDNFYGAHKGVYHKLGTWDGNSVAIIEMEGSNQLCLTHPEFVRFTEPYGIKKPEQKRLPESRSDSKKGR